MLKTAVAEKKAMQSHALMRNTVNWDYFAGRLEYRSSFGDALCSGRTGRSSVSLIGGEPGIGKSRLLRQLAQDAREDGALVLEGYFSEHSRSTAYSAFLGVARQCFEGRPKQQLLEKLADKIEQMRELLPELGSCQRRRYSESSEHRRFTASDDFTETLSLLLRSAAASGPVVLCLDDLQRADEASLRLIRDIASSHPHSGILTVATYRDTEISDNPAFRHLLELLKSVPSCRRSTLNALFGSEIQELLQGLMRGRFSGEITGLASEIGRLSGGNPLRICETLHSLINSKQLVYLKNRWQSTISVQGGAIAALNELTSQRLPKGPPSYLQTLSYAAILGDRFEYRLLLQLSRLSTKTLLSILKDAARMHLLIELPPEEEQPIYGFAHATIRHSLIEALSLRRARALHLRAARVLEFTHKDNLAGHCGVIANHYIKTNSRRHLHRAIDYLLMAAERECKLGAAANATDYLRKALDLTQQLKLDDSSRANILIRLGDATVASSTILSESQNLLRAALALYSETGELQKVAEIHTKLNFLLSITSEHSSLSQALEHSRAAWTFLNTVNDDLALATLNIGDAIAGHAQFRTGDAIRAASQAMAIGERLANDEVWSEAAALYGHMLWASGHIAPGLLLMGKAMARSMTLIDAKATFGAAWLLSFSLLLLWDVREAEGVLRPAIERIDPLQNGALRHVLSAHLGICHAFAGRLDKAKAASVEAPHRFLEANVCVLEGRFAEAEQILESEIGRARAAESLQQEWVARFWLARLRRALKAYEPAEQQLRSALCLLVSSVRVPEEIATRAELALLLAQTARTTEALVQIGQCDVLLAAQDSRALRGFVHRAKAVAFVNQQQMTVANQEFERARVIFRDYGVAPEEAEVLVLWAECLIANGHTNVGKLKFAEAFQIYYRLNLGPRWLERCAAKAGPEVAVATSSQNLSLSETRYESPEFRASLGAQQRHSDIYSFATTEDLSLLATLMHNAIAHTMNTMDRLSKLQRPLDEIARVITTTRDICAPIERIAEAFERAEKLKSQI